MPGNDKLRLDIEFKAKLIDNASKEVERIVKKLQRQANLQLKVTANTREFSHTVESEIKRLNKQNINLKITADTSTLNSQIKNATKNLSAKIDIIPNIKKGDAKTAVRSAFGDQKINVGVKINKAATKKEIESSIQAQNIRLNPTITKTALSSISNSISSAVSDAVTKGINAGAKGATPKLRSTGRISNEQNISAVSKDKSEKPKIDSGELNKQLNILSGNFNKVGTAAESLLSKLQGASKELKSTKASEREISRQAARQTTSTTYNAVRAPEKTDGRFQTVDKIERRAAARIETVRSLPGRIQELQSQGADPSIIKSLQNEQKKLTKAIYGSEQATKSFSDRVQEASSRLTVWASSITLLYGSFKLLSNITSALSEVENEFVAIRQAISLTDKQAANLEDTGISIAKTFGVSLSEVNKSFAIFAQQGRSFSEIIELTRTSAIGANVTLLKTNEVTELLTATVNQFKIDANDSITVIDKISNVAANSAVTSKVLGDAIRRTGAAASEAGVNLDQLNGIVAAIGTATRQTGGEIGTGLRFIFQRIQTKPATDALKALGIETKKSDGSFRDTYDILGDLAARYEKLSDQQKLNSARAIAGTRHFNSLSIALRNWDQVQRATLDSQYSQGTALEKNDLAVNTLEKSITRFNNSLQELYLNLGNNTVIKGFIDAASGLVNVFSNATAGGSSLLTVVAGLGAARLGAGLINPSIKDDSLKRGKEIFSQTNVTSRLAPKEILPLRSLQTQSQYLGRLGATSGNLFKESFTKSIGGLALSFKTLGAGLIGAFINPITIALGLITGIEYILNYNAIQAKNITKNFNESTSALEKEFSQLKNIQGSLQQINLFSKNNLGKEFDKLSLEQKGVINLDLDTTNISKKLETADKFQLTNIESGIKALDQALNKISSSGYTSNLIQGFDEFGNAIFKSNLNLAETEQRLKAIAEFNLGGNAIQDKIKLDSKNLIEAQNDLKNFVAARETIIKNINKVDISRAPSNIINTPVNNLELTKAAQIANVSSVPTAEEFKVIIKEIKSGNKNVSEDNKKLFNTIIKSRFGKQIDPTGITSIEGLSSTDEKIQRARNEIDNISESFISTFNTVAKLNPTSAARLLQDINPINKNQTNLQFLKERGLDINRRYGEASSQTSARTLGVLQRAAGSTDQEIAQALERNIPDIKPQLIELFKKQNANFNVPPGVVDQVSQALENNYKDLTFNPDSQLYKDIQAIFDQEGIPFDDKKIKDAIEDVITKTGTIVKFANQQGEALIASASVGGRQVGALNITGAGRQKIQEQVKNLAAQSPERAEAFLYSQQTEINKLLDPKDQLKLAFSIADTDEVESEVDEFINALNQKVAKKAIKLNIESPLESLTSGIGKFFSDLFGGQQELKKTSVEVAKVGKKDAEKAELEKISRTDVKIGETALEKFAITLDLTSTKLKILSDRVDLLGASYSDASNLVATSFNNLDKILTNVDAASARQAEGILNYIQSNKNQENDLKGLLNAAEVALNTSSVVSTGDPLLDKRNRLAALDQSVPDQIYSALDNALQKDAEFLNAFSNIIDFTKKNIKPENIEQFINDGNAQILAAAQNLDVGIYIEKLKSGDAKFLQTQTQFFDQIQQNYRKNAEVTRRIGIRFAEGRGTQNLSQYSGISKALGRSSIINDPELFKKREAPLPFANISGDVLSLGVNTKDQLATQDADNKKIQAQLLETVKQYSANIAQVQELLKNIATTSGKTISAFQKQAADEGQNVIDTYQKSLALEKALLDQAEKRIQFALKEKQITEQQAKVIRKNFIKDLGAAAPGTISGIQSSAIAGLEDFKANKFIADFNAANNAADKLKQNLIGLSIASGGIETEPITRLRKDLTELQQLGVIDELNNQIGRLQTRILFFGNTLEDSTSFAKEFRNTLERVVDLTAKASNFDPGNINIATQAEIAKYKSDLDAIESQVASIKVINDAIDQAAKDQIKNNLAGDFTIRSIKFDGKKLGSQLLASIGDSLAESRIQQSLEQAFSSLKNLFKFDPTEADLSNEEKLVKKLEDIQNFGAEKRGQIMIDAATKANDILTNGTPFQKVQQASSQVFNTQTGKLDESALTGVINAEFSPESYATISALIQNIEKYLSSQRDKGLGNTTQSLDLENKLGYLQQQKDIKRIQNFGESPESASFKELLNRQEYNTLYNPQLSKEDKVKELNRIKTAKLEQSLSAGLAIQDIDTRLSPEAEKFLSQEESTAILKEQTNYAKESLDIQREHLNLDRKKLNLPPVTVDPINPVKLSNNLIDTFKSKDIDKGSFLDQINNAAKKIYDPNSLTGFDEKGFKELTSKLDISKNASLSDIASGQKLADILKKEIDANPGIIDPKIEQVLTSLNEILKKQIGKLSDQSKTELNILNDPNISTLEKARQLKEINEKNKYNAEAAYLSPESERLIEQQNSALKSLEENLKRGYGDFLLNTNKLQTELNESSSSLFTWSNALLGTITSLEQLRVLRSSELTSASSESKQVFANNGQLLNNISRSLSESGTDESKLALDFLRTAKVGEFKSLSGNEYQQISEAIKATGASPEEINTVNQLIKLNQTQSDAANQIQLLNQRIQEGNRSIYRFIERTTGTSFGGAAANTVISSIAGIGQGGIQGLGLGLTGLTPEKISQLVRAAEENKYRTVDQETKSQAFTKFYNSKEIADNTINAQGSISFNQQKKLFQGDLTTKEGQLNIPTANGNLIFLEQQNLNKLSEDKDVKEIQLSDSILRREEGKVFQYDKSGKNRLGEVDVNKDSLQALKELSEDNGTKFGKSAGEEISDAMFSISSAIGSTIGGLMRTAIINTFTRSDFAQVRQGAEIGLKLGQSGGQQLGTIVGQTSAVTSVLGKAGGPAGAIFGSVAGEFIGGIAGKAIGELFVSDIERELNNFKKEQALLDAQLNNALAQLAITTSGVNFVLGHFKDIMVQALNDIGSALGSLGEIQTITQRDTFGFINKGLGLNIDELIPRNIGNFTGVGRDIYAQADEIDQSNSNLALGSLAGGIATGAIIGSFAGPIGAAVGALIGGIGGGIAALILQDDSDPVLEAMYSNINDAFKDVSSGLIDPFAEFKKQIISAANSLDGMITAMQAGTSELEVFSNINSNLSSVLNLSGRSVSLQGQGINIGNIRDTLNTTLTGIKKQQNAILNAAEAEIGARRQIINKEANLIRRRQRELREEGDTGTEEYANNAARLAQLTGELINLESIRAEALKEASELSIEYEKILSDTADQILEATQKIDGMRNASLNLSNALTYVTEVLESGAGIDAKSIFAGAFDTGQINTLLSNFFGDFSNIPGATGVGGGLFNLDKNAVLDLLKNAGGDILQSSGPNAVTAGGQIVALSAEQIQTLFSFDEGLASELAGQTVIEILSAIEQAQLKEAERFANQFDFAINKLVDVAVIGFDSLVLTSKEYLESMANDIKRWSDESQSMIQNIESAINKFYTTSSEVTARTLSQQLNLIQSNDPVDFFNAFSNAGKETFNILRATATGQLQITDQAKSFYGTQIQLLNDQRNALGVSLQALSTGLEGTISNFGINISDLDISGALDTSTLQTVFDRIKTAIDNTNNNERINQLLGLQTLIVNANQQLVGIESELNSTTNEILNTSRQQNELLNKIREDFKNQFEAPKRQNEFIRANLLYLRNLSNAIDTQTGGALLDQSGLVNRISEAEFASLKAIDSSQQIATSLEQFDELFGSKIIDGPKEITTFTKERPITNNFSIQINNNMLDASQLTNEASRRLALQVKEQLQRDGFNFRNDGGLN